jgi:hypothetical protein
MSEKQPHADIAKTEVAGRPRKDGLLTRAVRAILDSSYNTYFMPGM